MTILPTAQMSKRFTYLGFARDCVDLSNQFGKLVAELEEEVCMLELLVKVL